VRQVAESEITVHQGEHSASVRNMLKFMGASETPLLAGERVTVRAEGEDAERAVGFMAGVISGEIPRERWKLGLRPKEAEKARGEEEQSG
jgi:phosphotransferase system HPr-like phosphotransfer protein